MTIAVYPTWSVNQDPRVFECDSFEYDHGALYLYAGEDDNQPSHVIPGTSFAIAHAIPDQPAGVALEVPPDAGT